MYPHIPGRAEKEERKALTADFYLTSANAVSLDGNIVNIDRTGNRVGATCFGPQRVIYLIGKNKITDNLDSALETAKETAIKLSRHYGFNTPCAKTGRCTDCTSPESICSITTIHRRKPRGMMVSVFLIDEELGL